jgi:hypothetical protein
MRHAWACTLQPAGGFHFYVAHPARKDAKAQSLVSEWRL